MRTVARHGTDHLIDLDTDHDGRAVGVLFATDDPHGRLVYVAEALAHRDWRIVDEAVPRDKQPLCQSYLAEFNPHHDRRGRFARRGQGTDMGLHHASALRHEAEGGGFTFRHDRNTPSTGFMVSERGAERVFNGVPSIRQVRQYMREHGEKVQAGNAYFGGWVDSGKTYLDVSHHFGSQRQAERFGHDNSQLGIFDLEKHDTIRLETAKRGPL